MSAFLHKHWIWLSALAVSVLLIILVLAQEHAKIYTEDDASRSLNTQWYYMEENHRVYITLPATLHLPSVDTLELFYDGELSEIAGQFLSFKGTSYEIAFYLGDQTLFLTREAISERNRMVLSGMLHVAQLPTEFTQEPLCMVYHSDGSGRFNIAAPSVSSMREIYRTLFISSLFSLCAGMLMLFAGLFCIGLILIVREHPLIGQELFCIAAYLLLAGFWSLLDTDFVQFISGYNHVVLYLDFYLFSVLMLPLLFYVQNIQALRPYGIFRVFIGANFVNLIVQSLLCLSGRFQLYNLLPLTQTLYFVIIIGYVFVLMRLRKKDTSFDLALFNHAFRILSICTAGAMLAYMLTLSFYRAIFQIGILCFISIILHGLVRELWKSMQYEAKASYYQKIAEEDSLTH